MGHRFCTKCGTKRLPGARFCTSCGKTFDVAEVQAAASPSEPPPAASATGSPPPASAPDPVSTSPGEPPAKNRILLPIVLVIVGCLLVGVLGTAAAFFFSSGPAGPGGDTLVDVGSYSIKEPDPARLVDTEEWGELPADQVAIVLEDGLGDSDAQRIAEGIGATVVGHVEFINLYQLETGGTTAEDLRAALQAAGAAPGVEVASPNIAVGPRSSIEGRDCSPLNDPMYSEGDNGRAYEMIGLNDAWDIIRASGVELQTTRVGIIDDVIYSESGHEFSPELHMPDERGRHATGKVRTVPIRRARDATATPLIDDEGDLDMGGLGHGTAVTHVVAADTSGGTAGVAGILGENLEVTVSVTGSGSTFVGSTDLNDPVRWNQHTYGMLEHMLEQIENEATVINCSWGPATLGPQNATSSAMMRKFLRIMAERHPDVIFVTAAGNSGQGLDGDNDLWGKDLPNLITVGALNHDGDRATTTDWYERADLERWYQERLDAGTVQATTTYQQWVDSLQAGSNYADTGGEVTLSAPGTGVPVGIGPDGKTLTSDGTSFAAPMVTGAIALMRSVNPDLTVADIKRILQATAASEVTRGDTVTDVPANMGAGVLRVDEAVLQVINEMRAGPPDAEDYPLLPPLDREALLGAARVKLTATPTKSSTGSGGQEWVVTAAVSTVGEGGAELQLKTSGQGVVSGGTTQRLGAPGEASWKIDVRDEHFTVRVHRLDTEGCAMLELPLLMDLSGQWTGSYTHVDHVFLEDEGWQPLTLNVETSPDGTGVVHLFGDTFPVTHGGGTIEFTYSWTFLGLDELVNVWTGTVKKEGNELTIDGKITNTGGQSLGEWQVRKAD